MGDGLLALWIIVGLTAVFVWLPARIFAGRDSGSGADHLFRRGARMVMVIFLGAEALAALGLLNAFTELTFCLILVLLARMRRYDWSFQAAFGTFFRRIMLVISDLVEFRALRSLALQHLKTGVRRALRGSTESLKLPAISGSKMPVVLGWIVAIGLTILLRFTHPLSELRLGQAANYQVLLAAHQLRTQQLPNHPVLPSIVAVVALLTSTDPMQVIRFLDPAIGCLVVFALQAVVLRLTMNRTVALASIYGLGIWIFAVPLQDFIANGPLHGFSGISEELAARQWSAGNLGLGTLFLLLGLLCVLDHSAIATPWTWADPACCVALMLLTYPALVMLLPLFSIAVWMRGRLGLAALTTIWIALAIGAGASNGAFPFHRVFLLTLPVALGSLAALLGLFFVWLFRLLNEDYAEGLTATVLLGLAVAIPAVPMAGSDYVEYDSSARQALKIESNFPRQRWAVIAPVEQLAEVYGAGSHVDLAKFATQYADLARNGDFHFELPVDDLFVFVEKQPFAVAAPARVSFETLVDPAYQNYRSPAGRSSIEFEAFQLCENYRRLHPDATVYYEDANLRVYHFRGR